MFTNVSSYKNEIFVVKTYPRVRYRNSLKIVISNYFDKWHPAHVAGIHVFVNHLASSPHSLNNSRYTLQNIMLRQQLDLTFLLSYEFPSVVKRHKNNLLNDKLLTVTVLDFRTCRTIYTDIYYHLIYNYTNQDRSNCTEHKQLLQNFFLILHLYL